MAVPKIYHPYRKHLLTQMGVSTLVGWGIAEWYWRGYAVPKVERRNYVMSCIEKERELKRQAMDQAAAELQLPAQGSLEDTI